jgi:hypothetical protein
MQALARTDVDNLDVVRGQGGNLRLRVTGVPNETEHLDAIRSLSSIMIPSAPSLRTRAVRSTPWGH